MILCLVLIYLDSEVIIMLSIRLVVKRGLILCGGPELLSQMPKMVPG